jgi:hypothetical protein
VHRILKQVHVTAVSDRLLSCTLIHDKTAVQKGTQGQSGLCSRRGVDVVFEVAAQRKPSQHFFFVFLFLNKGGTVQYFPHNKKNQNGREKNENEE